MSRDKPGLWVTHFNENSSNSEYIGSDGVPISESYSLYQQQCRVFRETAKKYKTDNLHLKNSLLHHDKVGYERSEEFERQVLKDRERHWNNYSKAFDVTRFDEDPYLMYECFSGKSKRIRIIRQLCEERNEEFTEDFDMGNHKWFTRFCTLSKFIQAGRMVIIKNRLLKVLEILRNLTPRMVERLEHGDADWEESFKEETEDRVEKHVWKPCETPCFCCTKTNK